MSVLGWQIHKVLRELYSIEAAEAERTLTYL